MFERLTIYARRLAERRAAERREQVHAQLAAELPDGVTVEPAEEGIRLSGPGLRRRLARDPALRSLTGWLR